MSINAKYLVGRKAKLSTFVEPFNPRVVEFLKDFSKELDNQKKIKNYPDLKALSFFCREKNILIYRKKYHNQDTIRYGLGLLFHITPSNIPTNFAYSLIFGLLAGNSNIIKVPSMDFEEIKIICKCLNVTLKLKKHTEVKNMIAIIKYSNRDEITKKLSLICDGRLIWGGDQTVKKIKEFETKPKSIDVPFSDRYSVTLLNSEKFINLPEYKKNILIQNFYNDTYVADQNACSSPHLILWHGKFFLKARTKFWSILNELVKKKYNPPAISSVDNFSRLASNFITNKNIKSYQILNKSLYVVTLKKIESKKIIEKSKWGFFYECDILDLKSIEHIVERKLQTITYFGFTKNYLSNFFKKHNFHGIDRIVPIGQALSINLIWDGYDLIKMLSREIDIK
jgi:hypothetical protein